MTTTILGVEYPGRPMFGSIAWRVFRTEQESGAKAATATLDAYNRVNKFGGLPPVDLTADMTLLPLDGLTICKGR